MLGKKDSKSLYSASACASEVEPPSAYQESATASLARAMNSESGYVLMSVCKVIRATSKRLCFIASMARSNRTLSGCLDPTLASGLLTFLLVQAAQVTSSAPNRMMTGTRRCIRTSGKNLTDEGVCPYANRESNFLERRLGGGLQQPLGVS